MLVVLNEFEQVLAQMVAKKRYESSREKGIQNRKVGGQSNEVTDLEGVGAELAFAKWSNIYPDLDVGRSQVFDAVTSDGITVDVKSTTYSNGRLIVAKWKIGKPSDRYCLVVGKFPEYKVIGWKERDRVFNDRNIRNLGRGEVFALEQHNLNPMNLW